MRAAWVGPAALLGLALSPTAQAACTEAFDEIRFRTLVLQAQAAVDRGDTEQLADVLADAEAAVVCFGFAPEPRLWADYLVTLAINAFAAGQSWEPYLRTAVALRPGIDRGVGAGHPLARWEAPLDAGEPGPALPANANFYVDGLPATHQPHPGGAHLIQRQDGRWWSTILVVDQPLPAGWAETPAVGPPRVVVTANAGLGLFGTSTTQRSPADRPDGYLPASSTGATLNLHLRGLASFYSPLGVAGEISAPVDFGGGWRGDLRGAVVWAPDRRFVGVGVGLVPIDVREGLGRRSIPLAWPHVVAQARGTPSRPWDLGVVAGGRRGLGRLVLQGGIPLRGDGPPVWRLGGELSVTRTEMWVDGLSNWPVTVGNTAIGLQLDRLLGEP